ncbi:hypothetical protein KJZ99_06085 [bacterium]|nr:hypothetical protein [bacterium]
MFYVYSVLFWFVLLAMAIANAALREMLLKPWLEEYLGKGAHQLSVFTGYALMLLVTMLFLKLQRAPYVDADLWKAGVLWCVMTIVFEFGFGRARGMSWEELFAMYHLWKGELWPLMVAGIIFLPWLAKRMLN